MRIPATLFLALCVTGPLAGQSGRDSTAKPPSDPTQQGYGAWFGSIPDMSDANHGILLDGVTIGSPAYDAGLLRGDRITMMAGDSVRDLREMVKVLRGHAPGETIEVVFIRKGASEKVKVTLGLRPPG
jgi:S1-C subfamily serine protease